MKGLLSVLFITFLVSTSFAQTSDEKKEPEEKKQKLIQSLNLDSMDLAIQKRETPVQEQVSVEAPEYPGLNISIQNPADSLRTYKPFSQQELQAYSDLLTDYQLTDYDRSELARPYKPSRLFRTTLPTD